MNIFAVDESPFKAAEALCDKHVVKMILESCQLLSTWAYLKHPEHYDSTKFYKPTHKNHPCTQWLLESDANVWWLLDHTSELCFQYRLRYGKSHASSQILTNILYSVPVDLLETYSLPVRRHITPFKQCMPEQYRIPGNPIQAYRNYMVAEKSRFAKWKLGNKPEWWNHGS